MSLPRAIKKWQCLLLQATHTLFHLTTFWLLDVTVPEVGLCSKAPHLKYNLSVSLPDQNLLCETNHQMERFLATPSNRIRPLGPHLA